MSIGNLVKAMNRYLPSILEELERLNDNLERANPRPEDDEMDYKPRIKKSTNGGYINGGKAK